MATITICPTCGRELLPNETCNVEPMKFGVVITLESLKQLLRRWDHIRDGSDWVGVSWLPERSRSKNDYIFWNGLSHFDGAIILEFNPSSAMVKVWADKKVSETLLWFATNSLTELEETLKGKI